VDSIFPPEEALRRFRATVAGEAPSAFSGGAASTDALLRRYWSHLARKDTAALPQLVVSRAEFAYLYYPHSPEAEAGISPEIAWLLIGSQSDRGLARALSRAEGAMSAGLAHSFCEGDPRTSGEFRMYGPCAIVLSSQPPDTVWLARTIVARNGVFKLLGLINGL
jgi:hypothetical protein